MANDPYLPDINDARYLPGQDDLRGCEAKDYRGLVDLSGGRGQLQYSTHLNI